MPINPIEINNDNNKKSFYFQSTSSPPSTQLTLLSSNCTMKNSNTKNILIANPSFEILQCRGCKLIIEDKYVLNLNNDYWHETCLTCSSCGKFLQSTCYHKNMQYYCKDDYFRLFGAKCNHCNKLLQPNDLVMRTSFGKIFHTNCFKCTICDKSLKKGDEYFINDENLFCKHDYELAKKLQLSASSTPTSILCLSPTILKHQRKNGINDNESDSNNHNHLINNSNSSFNSNPSDDDESIDEDCDNRRTSKRPRTILTSSQRRKFRDAFGVSQKPCRKVREQLAAETGLTVRVVQVWFQNERAKMKKLQRRQHQPNGTEQNDDKTKGATSRSRKNKNKLQNSQIEEDDEELVDDDESETCSDYESDSLLQNNLIKLHNNSMINKKDDHLNGIFSSSSNSSNNSLYHHQHQHHHQQQHQQANKQNNFQQLVSTSFNNCETNTNEHFENMISNQEIANNNFYNQKCSDKPLSLCDFTSNGQSSGPSSNLSTSSTTSLASPFCSSNSIQQHLSSFFINSSENMNILQKDEQNPIDRLYSMQNSYFCSKC